ncbi:MAG TPA: hypothetical protein VJ653_04495 [Acidimicrobiales bacterium]|nr:hypothetical protein [Acidimicrobiales bacterium]
MTSLLADPPAGPLLGAQRPRIFWTPPGAVSSAGAEAVELAARAGLDLDDWQAWLLEVGLAEAADGNWLAFEVAELLSRQNGKGGVLEAVVLAGLHLFGDRLIGWSAHEFKTCREGFLRVAALHENSDELRRRVRRVRTSHGEEGIELVDGRRLLFMARSTGSGRGFTGDRLVLDEAQHLGEAALEAVLPTMSARPNPQVWYAATAPDKDVAPCGVLARLRRRALRGSDASLTYAEWSIDPHDEFCGPGCGAHDDPASVRSWAKANPALGIRISVEHVAREFAAMTPAGFAKERLGVGNWPLDEAAWQVIGEEAWNALADPAAPPARQTPAFAADVTPDRSFGSIAVAAERPDGHLQVEVVDHQERTAWMVPRLLELQQWKPCAVVIDPASQAVSLIPELEAAGVEVTKPTMRETAQACGLFYQAVSDSARLRHLDQPELTVALAGAERRPLSDAWAWARKSTSVDITPLVAATLAVWGHATRAHLAQTGDPNVYVF